MKRSRIFVAFALIGLLAACSREPAPPGEAGFLRLIDHLTKQNVLTSPLKEHPESSPKEAVYPPDSSLLQDGGTGENPFGIKRKCRVGGTARNILFAPPETRLRYDFDRLVGMELEFGIGILPAGDAGETRPDTARRSGGVSFQVELDTDRGKEVVFQKYLPLPSRAEDPVFSWQRIGLPEEAGRVRLSLITRGDRDGFSFWSNPILLEKKNDVQAVILISVDTLRGDHLGCYGYERETSPHVDTLAAEGVTFLKTYASSPWTLPSHVSLLSAFHTVHHQVYREDDAMDPSVVTLADIMRGEGFYCAGFTGGGFVSSVYGFSKGFDTYSDDAGSVYRQDAAEHLGRLVKEWLKTHTGKDFFLFLHTYQPHNPYACPPPYKTLFLGENPKWRHLDLMSHLGGKPGIFQALSDEEKENVIGLYDGEIRYTDERFIGVLVDGLKELGLYERALIVFTSDHGEEFYEHKGWGHGHSLYDESLKVPLIIKFPGGEYRGRRVESIVSLVDVFPTILDFLNLSDPQGLRDGRSLLPLIEGKEQGDRTFVADVASDVLHSRIPQKTAMNDGRLKLILNAPFPPEARDYFLAPPPLVDAVEVFDIEKDPGETTNIRDTTPNISRRIIRAIEKMYREAEKRNIQKLKMGEELKKQLKALGYIGRIS